MINKVILVGNVGGEPEYRVLDSGVKFARLRLATTERIYDRATNETRETTEWHTVVLWRGLADVADRFVHSGSQLYIEGSIHNREWTDRDNQRRFGYEIVATELKLLGRRSDNASNGERRSQPHETSGDYAEQRTQTPPPVPTGNPDKQPF